MWKKKKMSCIFLCKFYQRTDSFTKTGSTRILEPSGTGCLYRHLFKGNPHLSLKKKRPIYFNKPSCLIQKTLIKNFGGFSKLIITTVGKKPKWTVCESFHNSCFPFSWKCQRRDFLISHVVVSPISHHIWSPWWKGVVIHDCETFLLFREQCDLSKRLIYA